MFSYWVYILASKPRGTLYIGVTNDIARRVSMHKENSGSKFTKKYHVHRLVYSEEFEDIHEALHREKCLKKWRRAWKIELIERVNPNWEDWYETI